LANNNKASVLNYLLEHSDNDVSRAALCKKFGLSKSRLSELINLIRSDGYTISAPKRSGVIRLENSEGINVLPEIKDSDIRQWLIIFVLSLSESLTFAEIIFSILTLTDENLDQMKYLFHDSGNTAAYDNANLIKSIKGYYIDMLEYPDINVAKDVIQVGAFRKDLNELCNQKLVRVKRSKHTTYQLSSRAPKIIPTSEDNLYEFCMKYEDQASSAGETEQIKQIYNKINCLIRKEKDNAHQSQFGRTEHIDTTVFSEFNDHKYKTNLLEIEYDGSTIEFGTGLIYYCADTSKFYVLGKNISENKICSLQMDQIEIRKDLPQTNKEFHNNKYYEIYNELFSSGFEDKAYRVKVLVSEYANVKKRFSDLMNVRSKTNAVLRPISNPPPGCDFSYVYEDTVRGLSDFADYISSFGFSAIAVEPPELRNIMIDRYKRTIKNYEGADEQHF